MKKKIVISLILTAALLASCSNAKVETTSGPKPSDPEIKDESETLKRITFYRDGNQMAESVCENIKGW